MPKINTAIVRSVAGAGAVAIALFTGGFEGFSNRVYNDTGDVKTVCVGHAYTDAQGKPLRAGESLSDDVCSYLLGQDIASAQKSLHASVSVPLSSGEELAYTDFIFNLGAGAWRSSSMRRLVNQGKHAEACKRLLAWDTAKVNGKQTVLPGLQKRREAEEKACLAPSPASA